MRSRLLLNLLLLAALAILVAVAYFEPGKEPETTAAPLLDLSEEEITRLELQRPNRPPLRLERQGGRWRVTGDPPLAAADFQVNSLLRLAEERPQRSYRAGELDLAQVGLADSQTSVRFNDILVRFGDTDPIDRLRYVALGDQIHLVSDLYHYLVVAPETSFLDRRLLPGDAQIQTIELPGHRLGREESGAWRLEPEQPELATDDLQGWVEEWSRASALEVARAEGQATGETLTVELADGNRIPFQIITRDDQQVLLRTDLGLEYRLSPHSAERLLAPPAPTHPEAETREPGPDPASAAP